MDTAAKRGLANVVTAAMKRHQVPGVSIGIWHDGAEYLAGYGVTNIEFPLPVDKETLFQIGSTTKTITGTLVMQLVEEGLVDLEDPVRKHLPKFRLSDESAAKKVRIKHLVTHLGGWHGDYFKDTGRGSNALARIVTGMRREVPQLTPVGALWAYNNAGFHVLGRIIEVLRKKPYEEVVAERIFKPLGMTNSYFFSEDIITHKAALGHVPSAKGIKIARPFGLPRAVNPAGGVTSTAADQIRWARFHLGHDLGPDAKEVLSRRYFKQMQTPRHKVKSSFEEVGITWLLDRVGGARVVRHGGSINGQMSAFQLVPKHDFAITVLTNGALGHLLGNTVTKWCFERLLGLTTPEPAARKLPPAAASRYAGTYKIDNGVLRVVPNNRYLSVRIELDEKAKEDPEALAGMPEQARLMLTRGDRFVVLDEPWTDSKGDFVRDKSGKVVWIRILGRIYRRISDEIDSEQSVP